MATTLTVRVKAASEIIIASYRDAFLNQQGVAIASARAGNVIGGGDWSRDRIIPDAVRAWQNRKALKFAVQFCSTMATCSRTACRLYHFGRTTLQKYRSC